MSKKTLPTTEESEIALRAQSPITSKRVKSDSNYIFRSKSDTSDIFQFDQEPLPWIRVNELFIGESLVSRPFAVTRAWRYTSEKWGDRIGIEILIREGDVYVKYGVALGKDEKREAIVRAFEMNSRPIAPRCFVMVATQYSPYYDYRVWDEELVATYADLVEAQFEFGESPKEKEVPIDSDIPF